MGLINRDTDYAIRALCFIAQGKKKRITVSELAKALKMPHPFLRKILQKLSRKKVLNSYKGKDGGFSLALALNKIFLADLMKIFQGPVELNQCFLKRRLCPNTSTCLLKGKIDDIERKIIRELTLINIASLAIKGR